MDLLHKPLLLLFLLLLSALLECVGRLALQSLLWERKLKVRSLGTHFSRHLN